MQRLLAILVLLTTPLASCAQTPSDNAAAIELIERRVAQLEQAVNPRPPAKKYRVLVMQAIAFARPKISDAVAQQADGIVLRIKHSRLEPQPGRYDFTWVKEELARAKRNGNVVELQFLTADDCPDWLYDQARHYRGSKDGQPVRVVYPWDTTYHARLRSLLRAAREQLDLSGVVEFACPGADNAEWHYRANYGKDWYQEPAVTDDRMSLGKRVEARICAEELPQHIKIGLHLGDFTKPWVRPTANKIIEDHGDRISVQTNALNGKGTSWAGVNWIGDYASQGVTVGFEEVTTHGTTRYGGPVSVAQETALRQLPNGGDVSVYQGNNGVPKWVRFFEPHNN